jgi:hypothetical protein
MEPVVVRTIPEAYGEWMRQVSLGKEPVIHAIHNDGRWHDSIDKFQQSIEHCPDAQVARCRTAFLVWLAFYMLDHKPTKME